MAVPLRPRNPVAPPSEDPPPKTSAANDNQQGVLGKWENGTFRFASPAAEEAWIRRSYKSGVNAETWARGKELDARSVGVALAGLGGPMPGLYLGPDGTYRTMNRETVEASAVRDHRNQHLSGKTMDQLAAAGNMPGEDDWVERWKAGKAANDNEGRPSSLLSPVAAQVPPKATQAAAPASAPVMPGDNNNSQPVERPTYPTGRYGGLAKALSPENQQDARDIGRIVFNSVLGNYGDELRAAAGAAGAFIEGKSFGDTYQGNLRKERVESTAAQDRQGLAGTGVELLTSFIPIVGDMSGAAADFKDWQEHGDEWGWRDYGLVAMGLIPELPNRKAVKSAEKIGEELLGVAKIAEKKEGNLLESIDDLGKSGANDLPAEGAVKNAKQAEFDPRSYFPKDENDILTEKQVLNLPGEKVGLQWVVEAETHVPHAAAYEREGKGYLWSKKHNKPAKPSLRYDNPDGNDLVKFDHLDPTPEATYLILVDSKSDVPPSFRGAEKTAIADLGRQVNAVRQNNKVIGGPKFKIRYELPDESRVESMITLIKRAGYEDEAIAQVREASQRAQELFKKLRKK